MSDDDPFESPKLLLENAKEALLRLQAQCESFANECVGEANEIIDSKHKNKVLIYKFKRRISNGIRVTCSNVVNDLRHALDHTLHAALAVQGIKNPGAHFPIALTETNYKDIWEQKKMRPIRDKLYGACLVWQPFVTGSRDLHDLTRLAGKNKHEMILALGSQFESIVMNGVVRSITGPWRLAPVWNPLKQELEVARCPSTEEGVGNLEYYPSAVIPLAVGFQHIVTDESAQQYLNRTWKRVAAVIDHVARETL